MLGYCTCLSFFSPKKAMPISVISPVGYFYFIFLTIYNYQLLKAFPPKHLENSSAQWAIFLIQNLIFFWGGGGLHSATLTNYYNHFPKSICREFISPEGYFLTNWIKDCLFLGHM